MRKVNFYKSSSGKSPVEDFAETLGRSLKIQLVINSSQIT